MSRGCWLSFFGRSAEAPGVSREKSLLRVNRCFSAAILPGILGG